MFPGFYPQKSFPVSFRTFPFLRPPLTHGSPIFSPLSPSFFLFSSSSLSPQPWHKTLVNFIFSRLFLPFFCSPRGRSKCGWKIPKAEKSALLNFHISPIDFWLTFKNVSVFGLFFLSPMGGKKRRRRRRERRWQNGHQSNGDGGKGREGDFPFFFFPLIHSALPKKGKQEHLDIGTISRTGKCDRKFRSKIVLGKYIIGSFLQS